MQVAYTRYFLDINLTLPYPTGNLIENTKTYYEK
jgi:hypothetical protein